MKKLAFYMLMLVMGIGYALAPAAMAGEVNGNVASGTA